MTLVANIKIRKNNFTVENGYFYTFDDDQDALLQKTDDGNTAFSYPCDVLLTNVVHGLEYDGVSFWTLETDTTIVEEEPVDTRLIKRWKIDNYICKLQETIPLDFGSSHPIDADCFALEHYHTALTTTTSGGSSTLYIDDYSNNPNIISDAVLQLGPNENGEEEEVIVDTAVFGGVTLTTPTLYEYALTDKVNFHRRIWLFNNQNAGSADTGALYKADSHTGLFLDKYSGGAYKDIKACAFYKIEAFSELGPTDMLMYAKGTNTLFVNVEEDKKTMSEASTVDDDFTGANGSSPSSLLWSTESGSPTIQSNQLYIDVNGVGTEGIISNYYLDGDFDVQVDCSISEYDSTYSGINYYQQSLELFFPKESGRFCKISRGYSTEFGDLLYQNFASISRKTTDTVISGTLATYEGNDINTFGLRIRRVASDIHLFYRTVISGTVSDWFTLGVEEMFDSDAQLILKSSSSNINPFNTYFDDLTYHNGQVAYVTAAAELPYHGSMVMDNVAVDEFTINYLDGMSINRNNMYRLHDLSGSYNYALSPLESFVTSISLSASPAIIAANGLSTTNIKAWVKDQFLQPIVGRTVKFSETGDGEILGSTEVNTDGNGFAQVTYQAGLSAQDVIVTAVVQQTN